MSCTYPHFKNSYDILGFLEENGRILEDDDYWKFLVSLIYDSSRPSNAISENLEEIHKPFLQFIREEGVSLDQDELDFHIGFC